MAHQQQIDFCESVRQRFPEFFKNKIVIDIGSLDINGNNQYLFEDCLYIGIDLLLGRNVDFATKGHELSLPNESVDIIISTECFEHDQYYELTLKNVERMLKPGGMFLFSCATTGRPEHGTRRSKPEDSPFTQDFSEWSDYYKNLDETDIRSVLNIDLNFEMYEFSINHETHDLYFFGIKKGRLISRNDCTFQIHRSKLCVTLQDKDEIIKNSIHALNLLSSTLQDKDEIIKNSIHALNLLSSTLQDKDEIIKNSMHALNLSDREILKLKKSLKNQGKKISDLSLVLKTKDEMLASSIITINGKDRIILKLKKSLGIETMKISNLRNDLNEQLLKYNKLTNSSSWKITKPLRFAGRLLRGEISNAFASFDLARMRFFNENANKAYEAFHYFIRADIKGLKNRIQSGRKFRLMRKNLTFSENLHEVSSWGIMTTKHTLFLADILKDCLVSHGWNVTVMTDIPDVFDLSYYIVLCPQMFKQLPPGEKRIAFQLEQSISPRWFTNKYFDILESSLAVLDYSLVNLKFLGEYDIAFPLVHYLPIGASLSYSNSNTVYNKEYDVLFYGDSNSSPRRLKMLEALKENFQIKVCSELYGESMKSAIRSSRLVVNLHYYENSLLEMPRIQECLSLGVPVISEDSQDSAYYTELNGAVRFFKQGSIPDMISLIKDALNNPISKTCIELSVKSSSDRFKFMVDRFLISMNFISPLHTEYMRLPIPISTPYIGLSLPETIDRRNIFNSEKPFDCYVFDAIRYRPGWVGCGLSYKALAQHALRNDIFQLTVMEDDVILPQEFEKKISIVRKYLQQNSGNWDIFSGVIASLHKDVRISAVDSYDGFTFVTINKMTSTVFNIYGEKALRLLASWNPNNHDSDSNTIDRYLESQSDLRVVVAIPFFVGHREEVHSTLWGFQNTQYSDWIRKSEDQLIDMARTFIEN